MLRYFQVLVETFQADLWKLLAACVNDVSAAGPVADKSNLQHWAGLLTKKPGHRNLFIKGVKQLAATTRPSIQRRHIIRINLPRRES